MISSLDRDFEFPAELLVQPQALIGFSGLDPLNNSVHRSIWDAFSASQRPDRPPVQFKLLAASHEFPCPKPKKAYDLHIPKGILKRGWMHKHLTQIPAVVVVFSDLDWDDPHWEERKLECASKVQSIRSTLEGRASRVCLVLIQRKPSNLAIEDSQATERAKEIFQAAELSNKSLYILPHSDQPLGFTAKLEIAFYDLAKNYYHHEIRLIKAHRESLNKKNHQYLFVRHHFKIGFFFELRKELSLAHASYEEAYNSLLEARMLDTNEFEVKTIAGYISYKVSRVLFALSRPRDAFSHFRAHIGHYKHKTGHSLLIFQHYAWLSKQFSIFAELLEEVAYQSGIHMQTQHPGFYYKYAAEYSENRKKMAIELCKNAHKYPEPDPLANWDKLEFYGQRPWRPCQLSAEPLDPELERQGIQAIQYNELHKVDQSTVIIGLLGNAISQFKKYKCPRMRRHLVVQMADEYYEAKDYGKSLTLLTHMLWDYRVEKWYKIVDTLLVKALATAFLSAAVSEYLNLCLEAVSRCAGLEASRVVRNMITVTNGGVPDPEPNLRVAEVALAQQKWSSARSESPTVIVDSSLFVPPIQIKAAIIVHEYNNLKIRLLVRSHLPEPIYFSFFKICLSRPPMQHVTEHPVTTSCNTLTPGELISYYCEAIPGLNDAGKIVQISSIQLAIGTIVGRTVVLSFNGSGNDPNSTYPELMFFKQVKGSDLEFLKFKTCLSAVISRRDPCVTLKVSHNSPALQSEWYPIRLLLDCQETSPISDAFLIFNLSQKVDQDTAQNTEFSDISELMSFPVNVQVDFDGSKFDKCFFVKCDTIASRHLDVKFSYIIEGHCCSIETVVNFDVIASFIHSAEYQTMTNTTLKEAFTGDSFKIRNTLSNFSPWPIHIHSATVELEGFLTRGGVWLKNNSESWTYNSEVKCYLEGVTLNENESADDVACVVSSTPTNNSQLSLGTLSLMWSRTGDEQMVKTTSLTVRLPEIKIIETHLTVEVDSPGSGVLRELYPIRYLLKNRSSRLLALRVAVESSEEFLFAGSEECDLHLRPNTTLELEYNLIPLRTGQVKLPEFKVQPPTNATLPITIVESDPTEFVFIFPQSRRSNQNAQDDTTGRLKIV